MANHVTPELLKALDNLKTKYPDAFVFHPGRRGDRLENYIPFDDPDLKVRNKFLQDIREGDWQKDQFKNDIEDLLDLIKQHYTLTKIAKIWGVDRKELIRTVRASKALAQAYNEARRDFDRVILLDSKTLQTQTFSNPYNAARKLGVSASNLNFYLKLRHEHPLINDRYKVKREVWYVEDGGF